MEEVHVTGKKLPPHAKTGFGILDGRGVCINPQPGEMLKGSTRLLEILKIEKQIFTSPVPGAMPVLDMARLSYDLVEYLLPAGWQKIATTNDRLQQLKNSYPRKELTIEADMLEDQIAGGKLTWWWVVEREEYYGLY